MYGKFTNYKIREGRGEGSLTYMLSISAAFMTRFEMRNVLCH